MGRSLLRKNTVLAAKLESTVYTLEPLGAPDSNYNVFDVVCTPNIEQQPRQANDGFADRANTTGLKAGTITFKCDLHGNGAGGVPTWASTFFPACALVDLGSGVFGPVTGTPWEGTGPDNGIRTLTIAVYEDGRRKMLTGAMGTAKFMKPTGKSAYVEFSFQGCWTNVTDATLLSPAYPAQKPMRYAAAALTLGAYESCVAELAIDLGNNVQMRECQKNVNGSGYRGAFIGGRTVVGNLDPEAKLVADYAAHNEWVDTVERALTSELSDSNDSITFSIPKMQLTNVGDGDRKGLRTDPLTFKANRDVTPDDELRITFAAAS